MASVLAYCHRLTMPLEHFVYLLVGLMPVVCNCREFWIMRNLHALLGVQQGFRHELATNYAFLINLKNKESCDNRCTYRVILIWWSLSAD